MVTGPKPYPKNSKTHPQYLQTAPKDFQPEKEHLLKALQNMVETKDQQVKHAMFGVLSSDEKGWAMYKHLDHHLTQFGV